MKRASLTAYPTTPPAEPVDLTDRLLENERDHAAPAKPATRAGAKSAKSRRGEARAKPDQQNPGPGLVTEGAAQANGQSASSLPGALSAVEVATEALRHAAQDAPARYDVALRYRLDALAYHLQQVKEVVASVLAAR